MTYVKCRAGRTGPPDGGTARRSRRSPATAGATGSVRGGADDLHRQLREPGQGRHVGLDVRAGDPVEQLLAVLQVVHDVPREQHPLLRLEQADAAGTVAGQVQRGEHQVAEVDDVAVLDRQVVPRRAQRVAVGVEPGVRGGVEQQVGQVVRRGDAEPEGRGERRPAQRPRRGRRRVLSGVGQAGVELVRAAEVVQVRMRDHEHGVALEQPRQRRPQRGDTQPGVDDQVALGAAQVPDVGPQERVHVRLVDDGQPVVDPGDPEPAAGVGHGHDRSEGPTETANDRSGERDEACARSVRTP